MDSSPHKIESLTGKILLATPNIKDQRFQNSVIFICGHDGNGAIGLILNQLMASLTFESLLNQLEIDIFSPLPDVRVHYGGPVEMGRGFVLHSTDYSHPSTIIVTSTIALTATTDVLRAISQGVGPTHSLLALGYVGWSAGQIESEIGDNAWLTVHPTHNVLFGDNMESKWSESFAGLGGSSRSHMSVECGRA